MNEVRPVLVTVLVVTYNHERYIDQALQSVLNQQTDFGYEILVSEDCSTDETRAIIERYLKRHPERTRVLLSEENTNDNSVISRGLEIARGQYVALLDGDDYWSSTTKLQEQVAFLEAHPDCSMCFHNVLRFFEDGSQPTSYSNPPSQKRFSDVLDILDHNFIATCSAMIRTDLVRKLPEWYRGASAGDQPLYIFAAEHGPIGYIDRVMAVYRIHGRGEWSKLSEIEKVEQEIQRQKGFNESVELRYDRQQKIRSLYCQLAALYELDGKQAAGKKYFAKSLQSRSLLNIAGDTQALKLWVKLYVPPIAKLARRLQKAIPAARSSHLPSE